MSKAIHEMYRKKGVPFPKGGGKGIHTPAFHDMATSIKRDNPGMPMSSAYKIAMDKLGKEKAVKKGHRR